MTATSKNLDWIQMLRGIAAIMVVLCHARHALIGTPGDQLAGMLLNPGSMGVDLFFIISGFIMCYSTADSDGSPAYVARFAIKRFARVWPIYAVITLLSVFVLSGGVEYFHAAANRSTFWHSLAMIPANPHYVPYFSLTLLVGWTLEFEMYFYLTFAVSMLFKRLRWLVLAAWIVLTVILLPLGARGFNMMVSQDLGYSGYMSIVTNSFVLDFAAGVLIGWLYLQDWARWRSRYVAWHAVGLTAVFALWMPYTNITLYLGPSQYGWPLMLMVLAMAVASKTVTIRVPALCMWLGAISYSLYLTHTLSQGLMTRVLAEMGLAQFAHNWMYLPMSTALSLAFASLSHHYLERGMADKVRDWMLRWLPAKPAPQMAAAPAPISKRA